MGWRRRRLHTKHELISTPAQPHRNLGAVAARRPGPGAATLGRDRRSAGDRPRLAGHGRRLPPQAFLGATGRASDENPTEDAGLLCRWTRKNWNGAGLPDGGMRMDERRCHCMGPNQLLPASDRNARARALHRSDRTRLTDRQQGEAGVIVHATHALKREQRRVSCTTFRIRSSC